MLRILLWAPMGAGLHYSGVGANAYRLYRNIYKNDVWVTLVHAHPDQASCGFDEVVSLGEVGKYKNAKNLMGFLLKSRVWLQENSMRFDVMHGLNAFEETVTPASWAVKLGLPAVVKPASSGMGLVGGSLISRYSGLMHMRRRRGRTITKYVAISRDIEGDLLAAGVASDKIARIPNGVDVKRFSPVSVFEKNLIRHGMGIGSDERVILFVGSVEPRKRPHMILESLIGLGSAAPQCRCCFVGPQRNSEYNTRMKSLAAALPSQVKATFYSHTEKIEEYYRISDIFCLPSSNEGFPNALLEAMSCQLACISSPVSGSKDIIFEGVNGYIALNALSIAALLTKLCLDQDLVDRIAAKARETVLAGYSSEYVSDQHIKLFNEIKSAKKLSNG